MLAPEPIGQRGHSDWRFDLSPALDTGLGKPLESCAVVGLSINAPIDVGLVCPWLMREGEEEDERD